MNENPTTSSKFFSHPLTQEAMRFAGYLVTYAVGKWTIGKVMEGYQSRKAETSLPQPETRSQPHPQVS